MRASLKKTWALASAAARSQCCSSQRKQRPVIFMRIVAARRVCKSGLSVAGLYERRASAVSRDKRLDIGVSIRVSSPAEFAYLELQGGDRLSMGRCGFRRVRDQWEIQAIGLQIQPGHSATDSRQRTRCQRRQLQTILEPTERLGDRGTLFSGKTERHPRRMLCTDW